MSADEQDRLAELLTLRRGLARLRRDIALLRLEEVRKSLPDATFNPDQPRVPAGQREGGQWTRVAGAVTIDYSDALTGISTIDDTTKALSEILGETMERVDFIPEWTPRLYGTAVHIDFASSVRSRELPGISWSDVEQGFLFGDPRGDSPLGSIRTDVVLRNDAREIIAVYDVKTGDAGLSPARVEQLRAHTKIAPTVPIIELSAQRGATIKGRAEQHRRIGFVLARLWRE